MQERLVKIWNDPRRTPVLIGLLAFNIGTGFGYFLGQRKRKISVLAPKDAQLGFNFNVSELDEIRLAKGRSTSEVMSAYQSKDNPKNIIVTTEPVNEDTVEKAMADFEAIKTSRKTTEVILKTPVEGVEELVTKSIFTNNDDWNFAQEVRKRSKDEPYVIHRDEFFSEEKDYTQRQFTYYAGDNILCDSDNAPVYNHEQVTGPLLFGHGSGDPNVVYVRNDKRKEEYEVLLDQGLYSTEVLGLEIEDNQRANDLRHTRSRRVRPEDNE